MADALASPALTTRQSVGLLPAPAPSGSARLAAEHAGSFTTESIAAALGVHRTSPGAALAHQTKQETSLVTALESASRTMLASVGSQALARSLTTANAAAMWGQAVDAALTSLGYTRQAAPDEYSYLAAYLLPEQLGAEAYALATALMTGAAETYPAPPRDVLARAMDEILDLDSQSLLAAGGPVGAIQDAAARLLARIQRRGNTWRTRVRRSARTAFTGFHGYVATKEFAVQGVPSKVWVTKHDPRVRHAHQEADGQTVPIAESFEVGGELLPYPGYRLGRPDNVLNCRCYIVASPLIVAST